MLTPNDLEILIHYYVYRSPHPRIETPAAIEAIDRFVSSGILIKKESCWVAAGAPRYTYWVTEKGKVWMSMILNTPYPKTIWIDPRTNEEVK